MPDQEEVIEPETQEEVPAVETPEGELPGDQPPAEDGDVDQPNPLALQWDAIVPELEGQYDNIDPGVREQLLLNRLTETTAPKPTDAGAPNGQPGNVEPTAPIPPIVEVPAEVIRSADAKLAQAFADGDAQAFTAATNEKNQAMMDYMTRMGQLVGMALFEQQKEVRNVRSDLDLPEQLAEALPKVRGATAGDIGVAKAILRQRGATTPEAALKLAVYQRLTANPRTPSEQARRTASAINANRGATVRGGPTEMRIPTTAAGYAEMLRREEPVQSRGNRRR